MGCFVSSPREREIEEIVEEMKKRDGEKEENETKFLFSTIFSIISNFRSQV